MEHAKLWKRILNEGLRSMGDDRDMPSVTSAVIRSPIIVNPIIYSGNAQQDWLSFPVPFPQFFVDSVGETDEAKFLLGTLVRCVQKHQQMRMDATFIQAVEWGPPVVSGACWSEWDVNDPKGPPMHISADVGMFARYGEEGAMNSVKSSLFSFIDTMNLLSCKNVSLRPNQVEKKQATRASKRHGGNPDSYRYHTLVVRPPGARSDSPAQEIGIMPRHVCRGHMAEYGPEFNKGLLFGRHSGRFYIPPHLKGDKKNGIVEKDYELPATV